MMNKRERTTRIWVTRVVAVVSMMVALFVLIFSLFSNNTNTVYGLSTEVSTESELLSALESSEYDEIIVTSAITLSNDTTLDGDKDDDGNRKVIRARVTGTTDQGVVNDDSSQYTIFFVAQNATVHINNCIIKGGGTTAVINGTSQNSTNNNSTLYIDKCQISNSGSASSQGGGIKNTVGCKLVLTNSTIFRNVAEFGAGFQNKQGTFIMDNCSVSENRSLGENGGGGGGENTGNDGNGTNAYMYVSNSTIANNTSSEIGGGINNCKNGYLYVVNSTIAGNATTNGNFSGAGIGNNSSTLECVNCILLDNVYLSSTDQEAQDVYSYSSGTVSLDGCVYGTVTGKTTQLANAIDVEGTCYQASEDDSVFAATKTGSVINPDGTQGDLTYDQVALVTDENGVTYAPLDPNSKAIASNSSLNPVKVEFDYSDLNNIVFKTGDECSETTVAPTIIGGGSALSSTEKMATVTVFVNQDFEIDGGTVYGDSYIIDTNGSSNITLSATPVSGNENKTVVWALVNQNNSSLEIVSTQNPYTLDTSLSSTIMSDSWDSSKNSYDIVLQPISLSLSAEASDGEVELSWSMDWSNTYCASYSLANSITSYDIYYNVVNDFSGENTQHFGSTTNTSVTIDNLTNSQVYYFYVVPRIDNSPISNETIGYVSCMPEENGEKTYILADSIESGKQYLIVGTNQAGTGYALTNNSTARGSATQVTVESASNTKIINVDASDTMLWTVTKSGSGYIISNGTYYVYLNGANTVLGTASRVVTATVNSISYRSGWRTYYLSITSTTPTAATSSRNVYFYQVKSQADAPTTVRGGIQAVIGQDSGTITGIDTTMEYSTNGINWISCSSTQMTNMPVGKYFFRYKETTLAYASAPVTVEILEKSVQNINVNTNPVLTYTAGSQLDLSSLKVTIVYNDDTTTTVSYSDFTSLDSAVYQRSSGIITTSMNNGAVLECSQSGEKITVSLDGFTATTLALTINHKLTHVDALAATCEIDGNYEYYTCDSCGKVFDKNHNETTMTVLTIPAIGHSYGTPTYTWSSDHTTCTATVVCNNDSAHVITETVTAASTITTESTCTNTGVRTFTAVFNDSHFATQTATEEVSALGHDYDYLNGEWTWHNNYYVTVVFRCKNDSSHTVNYTATISNAVTKEATCEEAGIRTYTATVTVDGVTYTDTNEEAIPATGHNYLSPTYTWASDYSTCTATRVCYNDNSHTITETVSATSTITTEPTCTNTGVRTYTAVFENPDFQAQSVTETIPATGHDYDYANGVWNWDSVYYVTLTFICKNDSSHTDVHQANITNEVTKDATCEEAGIRTYTATVTVDGVTYTDTYDETISAIGHSYGTPTFTWASDYSTCTATVVCTHDASHIITETVNSEASIDVEATCEEDGRGLFKAVFTNTAYFYDQTIYTVIPALGHDYQITYTWDGNDSVTATAVCSHDSSHQITETVATTSVTVNPTCTDEGSITYTAVFTNDLFENQERVVVLDPQGHNYGKATYTWSTDNSTVTATRVCEHDNTHVETETVNTAVVTVNPTCTETGSTTYTATFTNQAFETQTKIIDIAALGHTEAEAVRENEVAPTCETSGSYDLVVYCTVCGAELSRETITVPALGHDYGEATYTWSSDNTTVTATRVCEHDNIHVETETVNVVVVTVNATCTVAGSTTYTATFTNQAFETQTKTIEIAALGHTEAEETRENEVAPTCTTKGSYDSVVYCSVCGEELSRETIEIAALGHTEAEEVRENEVAPTCEATGSYDVVVYCSVCGAELSRETITVPALGHSYGAVTYTWSNDNLTVTATRVCEHDNTHVETETVNTAVVTVNATCTEAGSTTYTAVFTNPAFATQTKIIEIAALGHTEAEAVRENEVAPTCETSGSYDLVVYCTVCGAELSRETITVPALGHDYGEATYTWSSDNTTVTATRVCEHDNTHVETETVNVVVVTVNATCTVAGSTTYTATFTNQAFETQTKIIEIAALGHTEAEEVKENEVAPTCETTGSYDVVVYCEVCGAELSRETITVPALGHDYGEVTYTWSDDNSTVTATRVCANDNTHIETETVATIVVAVNPTCEEAGSKTYTASFTNQAFETQTKIIDIPALGHSYGEVTYTWSDDNLTVTATRVCEHDNTHIETETVNTTLSSVDPVCTSTGSITYTATFANPVFEAQTKKIEVAALGHTEGEAVLENEVAPTCVASGSYDLVVYCTVCGEELSRETIEVPALGHAYGEVTYTWSSDNSTVTATRTCNVCGHIDTEDASTTEVTVNPTCEASGSITYTVTFVNEAFEAQTKVVTIAALGHVYGEVTYTWSSDNTTVTATRVCEHDNAHVEEETVNTTSVITLAPTCENEGSKTFTATFTNQAFETQTKIIEIAALGHIEAEAVRENEVAPTCETSGSYDLVVYCTVCGAELSRETIEIPALGHSYGEITYTWSADDSSVTATRVCEHNNTHVETETVTTSYKTTKAATCEETGILTYTAKFTNPAFATQTKDEEIAALGHKAGASSVENRIEATCEIPGSYDVVVYCEVCGHELSRETIEIPALGHAYGEVTYTWNADNLTVTATRVCEHDNAHVETETVNPTVATVNPTCTKTGLITYTATFTNQAFETQTKTTEIAALGHAYGEVTYTWSDDNLTVTATRVCEHDSSHVETETAATTYTTVPPTCEEEGSKTYTVVFTNSAFESQTKTIVIPALGHSYDEAIYTWSSDNTTVTATRTCSVCGHLETEVVNTTTVTIDPTCTATGSITYTVAFTNEAFETQTKTVEIPALGHTYGTPTYTWSDDLRTVTARVVCINDASHVITETVLTTSEITLAPTCEDLGEKTYRAVFTNAQFESQEKVEVVSALGHSYTHYDSIHATCIEEGMMEYYYCENCGKYFDTNYNQVSYNDLIVPALGHDYDYSNGVWTWSNDYSSATYKVICSHNASEVLIYDATITSSITQEATCTVAGVFTYTATVTIDEVTYTNSKTEAIPALGHDYDYTKAIWTWSDDYSTATLSFVCGHDSSHKDTYNGTISSVITINPTCEAVGERTYTATVSLNGNTYTDTKAVEIAKAPHTYTHYDEVMPTCEDDGVAEHYKCDVCGKVFDTNKNETTQEALVIPRLGHDYDYANGLWNFASDYSTATYTVSCTHDASHKMTYDATVESTLVSNATHIETGLIKHTATVSINNVTYNGEADEVLPMLHHATSITVPLKEATCEEDGNILYYHCVECGKYFSDSAMTNEITLADTVIPRLGHTYLFHDRVEPTCENTGMEAYYTCTVCGKVFDINKNETTLEALTIEALGHTLSEAVRENEIAPTCEVAGSYDLVVYCDVCGEELSRDTVTVPALGHTYLYHAEVAATCTESGMEAYYTCTVCGKVFDSNKKETTLEALIINPLGHTPSEAVKENEVAPTCDTEGSYESVVYCDVCGEELSRDTVTVPALGHTEALAVKENEIAPTCDTDGSYESVVYCAVCGEELSRETITVPSLGHTYLFHDRVEPTCENTGMEAYYTCTVCGKVFDINKNKTTLDQLEIPALGHTLSDAVRENEIAPTCDTEGSYDLVVYCAVCGEELSRETISVKALGHTYGDATYTWSSDYSKVTAERVCMVCGHAEQEVSTATSAIVEATCISDGNIKYTATFTNSAFVTQTYIEILPAIGHDYQVTYTWSSDNKSVTATAVCSHDSSHRITETVTTYSVIVPSTCEDTGTITYVAEFTDSTFESQSKVEVTSPLGHHEDTKVIENEVAPTCETSGSYDLVTYCKDCHTELSRETITVPALGHTEAEAVRENEVAPTCETSGSYDLVVYCSECGHELSRDVVTVKALGHTFIHHDAVAPTCSNAGNLEYYTCSTCGKYFDINKNETTQEALTLASLGHQEALAVRENEVAATCTTAGSYDLVVYCSICGEELLRETIIVPALGHSYGEATYTWSSDNSEVTAKMVCMACGDIVTEVVATTSLTVPQSCTEAGRITYTAEFTNAAFETQTKEVILAQLGHSYKSTVVAPTCESEGYTIHICERCGHTYYDNYTNALGHDYDSYSWDWNDDYSEARITFVCSHDSTHQEVLLATISKNTINPTCTEAGLITYTATATFNGNTYKDIKKETVDALGHTPKAEVKENEVAPTCDTNGSYDLVVYCDVCGEELSRETISVQAIGHDYDYANGEWSFASDYSTATYTVSCTHDASHKITYDATVESTVVSNATHIETGLIKHTAIVSINDATYTDEADEVLPMLHHETSITVPLKEATCEEDGNILYYHCVECGKYFSDSAMTNEITLVDTVIPRLGHTYSFHDRVEPTCENTGMEAYYTCTVCGKVFDTNKNETTLDELVIPALGHSYSQVVTAPTCENEGYATYTCDVCGDSYITDYTDALGHDYKITYTWSSDNTTVEATATCQRCGNTITEVVDTLITTKPASCKQTGLVTYKAIFENSLFVEQVKEEVLEKLSHTPGEAVIENLVSATCESEGSYDSVVYCTVCHEELSRETVTVSKVSHSYKDIVTAPTCENEGYTTHICERCGHTYVDSYIDALGHSYSQVVTAPTCETEGYTTYTCDVCGHTYVSDYTSPLGHKYEITYVWNGTASVTATAVCEHDAAHTITETVATSSNTTLASCEESGKTIYQAVFANAIFTLQEKEVILDPLGHTYEYVPEVSASCTEAGVEAHYICTVCGKIFDINKNETTLDELVINALGHSYSQVITAPTCTDKGYTTYICDLCGDSYVSDYQDPLGHSYSQVVTEPTCEALGYTTYTCDVCGDTYIDNYTDALGHDYKITYTWSSDNTTVTATATCQRCGNKVVEVANASYTLISEASCEANGMGKYIATFENSLFASQEKNVEIPTLGHDIIHHSGKAPTCTEVGYNDYDTCSRCDYTTYVELPALGHTPKEAVRENEVASTCDTNGSYDLVVYCDTCGAELSRTTKVIPMLGHSYQSVVTNPTCENEGYTTHTCTRCGDSYIDNYISALGHSYGEASYTWSSDNSQVTASHTCLRCGESALEVVLTTSEVIKSPTCTSQGLIRYTAVFNDFDSVTKDVTIPMLAHNPKEAVRENEVAPTCENPGSYESVVYCDVCGEVLSRETIGVPALGHNYDYSNGTWIWTNYSEAKYIVLCLNDGSHKVLYDATITSSVIKEATDTETGIRKYTATVNVLGVDYIDTKEEVIPTTNHSITVVYRVEPTCEASGNITYYYCANCDKYYKDAELLHEISYEETILPALGHDYVSHPAKAPTCTEAGYDSYQTCTRCDYTTYAEIPALGHSFKETIVQPTCDQAGYTLHYCERCGESYRDTYVSALGHDYKITYTWSSDYKEATAKAICKHDSSHVIIEVVTTKSTIIELVGCEVTGKIKYTAIFTNGLFDVQACEVIIPALGHTQGDMVIENMVLPTCIEAGSHDEVYYCTVCGEVLGRTSVIDDPLGHDLTHHEGKPATCTEAGYNPYDSCERCGYSTYTEIPALGHTKSDIVIEVIEEATCLATGAHYEVTYCTICGVELSRALVVDPALGHHYVEEVVLPTCTTQGYTTHTCTNCGRSYADTYVSALGHDYSIYEYVWSMDNSYCDAYAYCSHDHNHVIHELAYSSYRDIKNPTCEEVGLRIYTVEFTNIRFDSQTKNVEIPALGHSYGEVTYTWNEYNSIVTASRECMVCGHIDTVVSNTTSVTINPTCEEVGYITYTVEFTNPAFETQTKTVEIPALGHSYGEVTYTWSSDNSSCTATRICDHDHNHIEEESSQSTHITVLPTCLNDGLITYTVMFENRAFETQVKEVVLNALGHSYTYHEKNPATCLNDGLDEYYSCDRCGKIFDMDYNETSLDALVLEHIGHNYDAPYYTWSDDCSSCKATRICLNDGSHIEEEIAISSSVTVSPTCLDDGSITYTVSFDNPAFDTIVKKVILPALGHDYGEVSYVWSVDYKTVTATRICNHDHNHIEEETSYTTNLIKIPASCTSTGIIQYTAIFNNPAFHSQVLNVTIMELGHEYGLWYLVHSPSKEDTGLIERACKHDASHKERYEIPALNDIDYEYTIITPATGALDGLATYHKVFNGVDILVNEVIPAYGFNYTYYNNSSIVASYHGYDGDSLIVPNNPDSYVVNGYLYYFNGWDKEIPSELHQDMKFYAKFIIAAVIYEDVIIEIPDALTIDPSYRIVVEKDTNSDSLDAKKKVLTSEDDYSDFSISSVFDVMFEKDGKNIDLGDSVTITIKIKKDNISDLDSGTKLFYFDEDGKVQEISYHVDGEYVVFEMGKIGAIGFANDGFNWLWAVFIIQSSAIIMLLAVIVYRKKFKR